MQQSRGTQRLRLDTATQEAVELRPRSRFPAASRPTIRRMNWAFVDYENVGSLEALQLGDYERVFVFCGPKNTRIKLGTLPAGRFCRIELIGVTTPGANNLDFHMAFHIGRLHETAESNVAFHIVSNDSGFNGLVSHLTTLGRTCKKVATRPATSTETTRENVKPLSDAASAVKSKLKETDGRTRPRKREKLINWMQSQCKGLLNGASPEEVYEELMRARFVQESGSAISYQTKR